MNTWKLGCGLALLSSLFIPAMAVADAGPPPPPFSCDFNQGDKCDAFRPGEYLATLEDWAHEETAPAESEADEQEEHANSLGEETSAKASATSNDARESITTAPGSESDQTDEEGGVAEIAIDEETPGTVLTPQLPSEPESPSEVPPLPIGEPTTPDVDELLSGVFYHSAATQECGDAATDSPRRPDAAAVVPVNRFNPMQGNLVADCEPKMLVEAATWFEPPTPNTYVSRASRATDPWLAIGVLGLTLAGLLAFLLWPLYARLPQDRVALHPRRAALLEAIRNQPGVHREALLRQFPMGRGALEHHLQKLAAAEVIAESRGPRYTCYFVRDGTDRRLLGAAPFLKARGARQVLVALTVRPHSAPEIAASTGLSVQTVRYHLDRLRRAELIRQACLATTASYDVTESGHAAARCWSTGTTPNGAAAAT